MCVVITNGSQHNRAFSIANSVLYWAQHIAVIILKCDLLAVVSDQRECGAVPDVAVIGLIH